MRLFGPRVPDINLDLHLAQDDQRLRAAWASVTNGDWRPARDLMAGTRSDFDRRARYTWVLSEASAVSQRFPVDTTASWADRWAAAEPDNPDAVLVRARSLIMRGWEVRGDGWASTVGGDSAAEFHRLL